jgi:hypothetical protein
MESSVAARIFHDWAFREGLMDDAAATVVSTPADFALIENVTERGTQILRQRRICAIGFNDSVDRIVVFTKRVAPGSKKQLALLPNKIDNVEIKYRQGALQSIDDSPPTTHGAPAYIVRITAGSHRYTCGSSISVGNNREAGTLTCLVRDAAGTIFGLSNNHISGGCSYAGVGLPIVAPGIADVTPGGLNPFTLGFHHRALPLVAGSPDNVNPKTNLDAAIFRLQDASVVSSFQRDVYDTPGATGPISAGMAVEKVGRTTGHTVGTVVSQVYGANHVFYQAQLYGFAGPVYFDPLFAIAGSTGLFSDSGDSGSLITTVDGAGNRTSIAIVVGGMNDKTAPGDKTTLALPIEPILAGLDVALVSGHHI